MIFALGRSLSKRRAISFALAVKLVENPVSGVNDLLIPFWQVDAESVSLTKFKRMQNTQFTSPDEYISAQPELVQPMLLCCLEIAPGVLSVGFWHRGF